jgi:hypothetical protein
MTASSLASDDLAYQRRVVLINFSADPGVNNQPEVTAAASRHGDTANTDRPHRAAIADVAATIAATASASSDPAGSGTRGTGSRSHNRAVNADRTGPARAANRRSQPRTVAAGRSINSAIRRCPHPAAARTSAAPITTTASARRTSQSAGNNTCVRPQPEHRARRGRSRHRSTPSPRSVRARPYPHDANRPPHAGHDNNADDSLRSTSAASLPTVSTASVRRFTRRWIAPAGGRGSEGR